MKKLLNRFLGLLTGITVILSAFTLYASADDAYEPDNSFYKSHIDDCILADDEYIVNGPMGYIHVYQSPENNTTTTLIENGDKVFISAVYTASDGVKWGFWEDDDPSNTGWAPMAYLYRYYDGEMFFEQHEDEMTEESELTLESESDAVIWLYPGSSVTTGTGISSYENTEYWTDEEGRTWEVFIEGRSYSWVCLDAPTASFETLYPDGEVIRDQRVIDNVDENGNSIVNSPEEGGRTMFIICAAVVCVGMIASAWYARFAAKKRKEMRK